MSQLLSLDHSMSAIDSQVVADNDVSHITDFFSGKRLDPSAQYQIKVNSPHPQLNHPQLHPPQPQPQLTTSRNYNQQSIIVQQSLIKQTTTGYQINRELYLQSEITQAFKIIDIDHDGMISYEDICFFLEYIRQPYQPAEVYEMINLLSGDTMKVSLQDFMKIGLGTIVPLAAFKVPDTRSQTKQVILENVRQSELFQMEANEIVEAQREGIVSQSRFQDEKMRKERTVQRVEKSGPSQDILFLQLQKVLQLRNSEQMIIRRRLFDSMAMLNIVQTIVNYRELAYERQSQRSLTLYSQIGQLLGISQRQARLLYPTMLPCAKYVVVEAVVYGRLKAVAKMQYLLQLVHHKRYVKMREILHLLQLLLGKDRGQSLRGKLVALLRHKRIGEEEEIDKQLAYQLIAKEHAVFGM